MKNQKGITLIALVITIIVLLILAGVSISMVIGNNGILNQANDAKTKTYAASEKEQVELALLAAKMLTYTNGGEVDSAAINKQLSDAGVNATAELKDGELVVIFNGTNQAYKVNGEIVTKVETPDSGNGETGSTAKTLASQITESNYGDYVDLETSLIINDNQVLTDGSLPETDWRILYEDETGEVYLVLAGYLPYSYESTVGSGLNKWSGSYNWYSTSNTDDFLSRLSNTAAWNKLLPSKYTANGVLVTGSLDVQTLVASLNATGEETLYIEESDSKYYVGNSENPKGFESSFGAKAQDTLYCPLDNSDVYGYWLNSKGSLYGIVVRNGGTGSCSYEDYRYALRPMVYLPSDTLAQKVGDVWKIIINE